MNTLQSIAGLLILLFGTFVGIVAGNYFVVILSVTSGFLIMTLSKLVDINRDSNHRLLGIPLTKSQINTIINNSSIFYVESNKIKIYPSNEAIYPLIILDNEKYIRAKVFYNYLSQVEYQYTFEFPDETITLECADNYYPGVDLYNQGEQVLVKLSALNINLKIYKDRIILGE